MISQPRSRHFLLSGYHPKRSIALSLLDLAGARTGKGNHTLRGSILNMSGKGNIRNHLYSMACRVCSLIFSSRCQAGWKRVVLAISTGHPESRMLDESVRNRESRRKFVNTFSRAKLLIIGEMVVCSRHNAENVLKDSLPKQSCPPSLLTSLDK